MKRNYHNSSTPHIISATNYHNTSTPAVTSTTPLTYPIDRRSINAYPFPPLNIAPFLLVTSTSTSLPYPVPYPSASPLHPTAIPKRIHLPRTLTFVYVRSRLLVFTSFSPSNPHTTTPERLDPLNRLKSGRGLLSSLALTQPECSLDVS